MPLHHRSTCLTETCQGNESSAITTTQSHNTTLRPPCTVTQHNIWTTLYSHTTQHWDHPVQSHNTTLRPPCTVTQHNIETTLYSHTTQHWDHPVQSHNTTFGPPCTVTQHNIGTTLYSHTTQHWDHPVHYILYLRQCTYTIRTTRRVLKHRAH